MICNFFMVLVNACASIVDADYSCYSVGIYIRYNAMRNSKTHFYAVFRCICSRSVSKSVYYFAIIKRLASEVRFAQHDAKSCFFWNRLKCIRYEKSTRFRNVSRRNVIALMYIFFSGRNKTFCVRPSRHKNMIEYLLNETTTIEVRKKLLL